MLERAWKLRKRRLLIVLLGVAIAAATAVVALASTPTIEATNSTTSWTPNSASVNAGETVEFKNTSTSVPHGVHWASGNPATPSCTAGVPIDTSGMSWSGTCTFTQAGTYSFRCSVHEAMTGTVTVSGPAKPTATTGTASVTSDTAATLKGSVNPQGQATTYFFKYGTTTSYGQTTPEPAGNAGEGTSNVSKEAPVSGLEPATTYHFRIVATNATGTSEGADHTFTTFGPPLATTEAATGMSGTGATLKGTVNPDGHPTKYFFEYGETATYGQKTSEIALAAGTTSVAASASVTGLSPETPYHFRIVAKNESGTTMGLDKTFTTLGPPLVTTGQATGIGETGATLAGTVNPEGQETTYFFKYGTTTAYGLETSEKSAGKGTVAAAVSAALTGLSPGTTYHFQLVAKNGSGTTPGADQTFTTSSTPPPPPPTTTPVVTPPPPAEQGAALGSGVTIVAGRHGAPVRVSVQVLGAGAGGRLEVDLVSKGGHPKNAIAGRVVRSGVSAGKISLAVPLNARAKRTLRRKHRLALSVKIKLTPPAGGTVVLTRSVVVRA